MGVHTAWPPLACLAMFVIIIAFIIVKYGDTLFGARSVPLSRGAFEDGDQTSVNTVSCLYDERESVRDYEKESIREYVEVVEMPDISPGPQKKYEYAV
ncbi:uncharacterized protein LOC135113249 [Scylla paramamosain]|uniref:uncharacterized protein LOC135113249 n=1 Tax=Scylla paramamosain TaxID=85552 RepID=UPI0030838814